jgi:hypothetical protein
MAVPSPPDDSRAGIGAGRRSTGGDDHDSHDEPRQREQ